METIIIAAGFGPSATSETGIPEHLYDAAINEMKILISRSRFDVAASIVGRSSGGDWEPEDGIWFAINPSPSGVSVEKRLETLRILLSDWCSTWNQDAVALTVRGQTEFVSA